jgi:hypothetical protein
MTEQPPQDFQIQTVDTEMPVPAARWRTIASAATAEQAYELYLAAFAQRRADGITGRVQVLYHGTPISLMPAPTRRRR